MPPTGPLVLLAISLAAARAGGLRTRQVPLAKRQSISSIFAETSTDKAWRHGYHRYYESKLAPYRDIDGLRILEIGADSGKSLKAWSEYFSRPAAIQGVAYKVSPEAAKQKACEGIKRCDIVKIYYMDQSDEVALKALSKHEPQGWDVIIDDGSHVPAHQIISFQALFPMLRPGGLYVVEDIETSYVSYGQTYQYHLHGGIGQLAPENAVEKFKQLVDIVNRRHFSHPELTAFNGADADVSEVTFGDGVIFVHKKPGNPEWDKYPQKLAYQRWQTDRDVPVWLAKVNRTGAHGKTGLAMDWAQALEEAGHITAVGLRTSGLLQKLLKA
mmetsp:Transcript_80860/g.261854  ORF Transcript_80860/g.261854 Transcript_80860/m.261854 type:complete len:328 (+) Transcript_80860:48-1031(+)